MNRYKCIVNPSFKHLSLLKEFLLDEITICYSDTLSQEEVKFSNGYVKETMVWDKLFGYFLEEAERYYLRNYDYCFLRRALADGVCGGG